jgi:hypothetical protein
MARPLRILVPGGWYHVVNRGRRWSGLENRHGYLGRDGAMYYAVRHGGQRLAEVVLLSAKILHICANFRLITLVFVRDRILHRSRFSGFFRTR